MAKNLAGKSYEVFVAEGKRWIYDSTQEIRSAALQQAEELLASGNHAGVRVVAESERTGEEEIVFEERIDREQVIALVPVDEAPLCEDFQAFFRFPARRTAGRLLRRLLDDQGLTALELAYHPGQLMMFERNDRLFGPALQRIGGIQAKATGAKPMDRTEVLHKVFGEIKERAKAAVDADKYSALLKLKGLNALIEGGTDWEPEENRDYVIRGALATHITGRADWDGKLNLLIGLSRDDPSPQAVHFLDELVAEILDGAKAVIEVLAGQPDAAAANRVLINLSQGRCQPPKNPVSCIADLNDMLARLDMPLTQMVLLERVENEIGGIRDLTREGKSVDREAFVGLVRELAEGDGLLGGSGMCDAVVRRARMTLSDGETDLTAEQAIDHLMDLMPNRGVRLGFLLDLAASPLNDKEGDIIKQALDRLAKQLSFLASLVPDASDSKNASHIVGKLKKRLEREGLPEDWRKALAANLDELVERGAGDGKGRAKKAKGKFTMSGTGNKADQSGERKTIKAGDLVFEEGEKGDFAYLIVSGQVEIFRKSGNNERVLATLGRGEIIGEMALIDDHPRVASARALEDSEFSLISEKSLQQRLERLEENDRVLRRLIDVLVNRIRGQAQSPE